MPDRNRLIQMISAPARKLFVRDLQPMEVKVDDLVSAAGASLSGVYFPTGAVISAVCDAGAGKIDVHGVGREGMLGSAALLGLEASRFDLVCGIAGTVQFMPAARFTTHMRLRAGLPEIVSRYAREVLTMTAQSVACCGSHDVAKRCARWLLITADRVGALEFELTHALLARMLGVRRSGVSVAVNRLQSDGLIRYRLGRVRIVDKRQLEERSCECYRDVVREIARSR